MWQAGRPDLRLGIMTQADSVLCVLPALPSRETGGGVLLHELLVFLAATRRVAAVVPVNERTMPAFDTCTQHPELAGIEWHALPEYRQPGLAGYVRRFTGWLPADAAKIATTANHAALEHLRAAFRPATELAVSSWALAMYRGSAFHSGVRLFMDNVDPEIVRYEGPSLKRRLACRVDRPKVDRLCRRALASAGRVGAISAADAAVLTRMSGGREVMQVPPLMRPVELDRSHAMPWTALITTNFTYWQNVTSLEWFFRECWSHVDSRAQLTVTGRDAEGRLAALCEAQPRVTYAGCGSPAELDTAFARTAVAINPTRQGSGFQIKLLDALARGVPVVSTAFSNTIGPVVPSSDDPQELAALINARLDPGHASAFNYAPFYESATTAWNAFLRGEFAAPLSH